MNKALQNYIRQSFPEHSQLTVLEIYLLNYLDKIFIDEISKFYDESYNYNIIINDLIFIDLAGFFETNKEKYTHDFISDYCFQSNIYFKEDQSLLVQFRLNIDLYQSSYICFSQNIKNHNFEIYFEEKCLEYNQSSIDCIISNYISHIKQKKLRSGTMFSSLVGYIENETDLCHFFNVNLLSENALQINKHGDDDYIDCDDKIVIIEYKQHNIYIINQKSHIFYKADLRKISKKDFLNQIIQPLKSILVDINKNSKIDFYSDWENSIYKEIEYILPHEKMKNIKIKIYKPELKCNFLNKTIYSQRPPIEISFVLNNNVIWSLKMTNVAYMYKKDIIEGYQYYKTLSSITHDKIEVQNSMNILQSNNKKRRL